MNQLLKQNTAVTITVLVIDSASHYAGKTGLAAGLTIYAAKAGGAPAAITPTVSELDATNAPGLYSLALTTAHTNTLGELALYITAAGADPVCVWFQIIATDLSQANIPANVQAWNGSAPNALIGGRVDANAQVIADKSQYTLAAGEHTQIANDVLDVTASSHNTAGTIGKKISDAGAAGDPLATTIPGAYSVGTAGYILGTNLDVPLSAVKTQTDKFAFDGASNVKSAPQTDSGGVTTLLSRLSATRATYLDLLSSYLDASITSIRTIVNAIRAQTDLLPADPASETNITTAITSAQSAITAQTDLIKAKTTNLPSSPAAVGSQMDLIPAPNGTAITAIQSGLGTSANQTTILARLGAWTGAGRNTILGALQALFRKDADASVPSDINANLGSGAGTYDNTTDSNEAIRDNMAAASTPPTAQQNADAVWDSLRADHVVAGSFGQGAASVQGNVTGSVDSVTGAVGSVAGSVGGNLAGNVLGNVAGNVQGTVPDSSGVTTLLSRLSNARAGYLDVLAGWSGTLLNAIKALARKDATASTDIGGTHLPSTDSEEALREKIDTLTPGGTTTENVTVNELNT